MRFEFIILEWSAYADGLTGHEDWLRWAQGFPVLPQPTVQTVPALTEMPAMTRRRLDRLGRMACQVAYWCQSSASDAPLVFASRYGDTAGSLSLLDDLVGGQPLSPAGFGLSVHNAVSALYSIAQGHTHNTVVVAAGRATVAAALTEAAALLADGASEVLVVYSEAPLPTDYTVFADEPACEYAWAWRVARPAPSQPGLTVSLQVHAAEAPGPETPSWPAGLDVLRHVLRHHLSPAAAEPAVIRHDRKLTQWSWSVHA